MRDDDLFLPGRWSSISDLLCVAGQVPRSALRPLPVSAKAGYDPKLHGNAVDESTGH